MAEYKDFEDFARDLYLYSTEVNFGDRETVASAPPAFLDRAKLALLFFGDAHCSRIRRVLKRSLPKNIKTDEDFMLFVIPKCLNLIDERYFYSLLLVAAFIAETQTYLNAEKNCYRFALSGYKCLVAVFKRKFEEGFEAHNGFKGLDKSIKSFFKAIRNRKKDYRCVTLLNGCNRDLVLRVASLIKNCADEGSDQDFVLNDYERSVAEDLEASKEKWFRSPTVDEKDSPPELEWELRGLTSDGSSRKLKSVYDIGQGIMISSFADTGLSVEDDAKYRLFDMPDEEFPDSDVDTSGSESESESKQSDFVKPIALTSFMAMKPDEFKRWVSSRKCQFCETYCYQYGIYMFKKQAALAVRLPKWVKTAKNVLSKAKNFLGSFLELR